MVLGKKFITYETALLKLNLETLEDRRNNLNLKFAQDAVKNNNMKDIFYKNVNFKHNTRHHEIYNVMHANTERKRKYAILQMQHQLNKTENLK